MEIRQQLYSAWVLARRERRSSLYGLGLYIALTVAFIVAAFFLVGYASAIYEQGLMVLGSPLYLPLIMVVMITTIYLALSSSISISRERDLGTLEVLFYGPVSALSFVLGKFIEQIQIFAVIIVFYLVYFFAVSLVTNFGFSWSFVEMTFLSLFLASCMASFGIFLSVWTKKVRNSVILLILLSAVLLGLPVIYNQYVAFPTDQVSGLISVAQMFLSSLVGVVRWISPFSYLTRGIEAVELGNTAQYWMSILSSVLYTVVLLTAAVWVFARKGVRR